MGDKLQSILRSPLLLVLTIPLSLLYGLVIALRNLFYDLGIFKIHHVSIPVISVGNISTGGSGKTILVQSIARLFLKNNTRPAILSRGYGRNTSGLQIVSDGVNVMGSVDASGDEPYMMALNLPGVPVVVSENRVNGANYIHDNFTADVILLDDGFQHRRLHRDLNILLEDNSGSVVSHLLPWGDLRESSRAKRRADLILKSKSPVQDESDSELRILTSKTAFDLEGNTVHSDVVKDGFGVFSGLGNNEHFIRSIEDSFGPPTMVVSLPDHTAYSERDLQDIPLEECPAWITSQKDIIKLDQQLCSTHNILYLGVDCELPEMLLAKLKNYFK